MIEMLPMGWFFIGIVIGFLIGITIVFIVLDREWRKLVVQKGIAKYNEKTGKWEWIS